MKEMVGGCCVCSDERGWTENPLVYCDGQGCTVAVHQACYGIVSVPSGPWFCRKCESQDGSQARVRCDLCPSRDGALKRSDGSASGGSGWAHVVCALYIPEVRFGNVTTMEPIILAHIPPERYNRNCYICESEGRGSRATNGACMQCNKAGCRSQFHVTCAQSLGLLCEEAGNYMDNVKYCGYCQHHYSKLKGGNVKTIPPYKPVAADGEEEKERGGGKRKPAKPVSGKDDAKAAPPKPIAGKDEAKGVVAKPAAAKEEAKTVVVKPVTAKEEAKFVVVKPIVGKEEPKTVVVKPTPPRDDSKVSGVKEESKPSSAPSAAAAPKEENKFTTCNFTEAVLTEGGSVFGGEPPAPAASVPAPPPAAAPKETVLKEATGKKEAAGGRRPAGLDKKRRSAAKTPPPAPPPAPPPGGGDTPLVPKTEPNVEGNIVGPGPPIVVSVPLGAVAQMSTPPPTLFQQLRQSMAASATVHTAPGAGTGGGPAEPAKRRRSVSSEKPVAVAAPSARSKPRPPTANKRASRSNQSPPSVVKDSPPPSPPSPSSASTSSRATTFNKGKKKQRTDLKFASAAHMLGNRLNPSSHMSQKLGESLTAEVEAANANCGDGSGSSPLTGPQLHSRVIASVRQAASLAAGGGAGSTAGNNAASSLAGPLGMAFGSASAAVPQSLDQLLERQWEQGSQFLMEQAQHFDIASLLSCLHQLRAENIRLEEHVNSLLQRRDHLLAVNARLAIPLTTTPSANASNANVAPTPTQASDGRSSRAPYENGLDSVLYPTATAQTGNPSPRAAPRSNQSYPAGYQGGSPLPQQPHPKHS